MRPRLDGILPGLLVVGVALLLIVCRQLYLKEEGRRAVAADVLSIVTIVCFAGFLELEMGRAPTYRHGPVRLWSGDIQSDQNSQQFSDPYTFTHVIHGAAFYGLTRAVLGRCPVGLRALIAITAESVWEVTENTDTVINRYRATTVSLGYYGDSLINSIADILACGMGFMLAWRLRPTVTVISVVVIEVALAVWIRDNLTLNIIMLLHPFSAIRAWQLGAS